MKDLQEDDIFLDKIRLGSVIIEKEMQLINQVNTLISDTRIGITDSENISVYPLFNWAWQNAAELYDFLKNDYMNKLKKEKKIRISELIDKFRDEKQILSLKDLKEVLDVILEIMSLSKFHDILRKYQEQGGVKYLREKYGLNEKKK